MARMNLMTIAMAISERKQLPYMDVMIESAVESEKEMLPRTRIRSVHIPEEEIRKKVLIALEEIIGNNSHKYPIEDPNSAIEELKELGLSPKRARSAVVENLIGSYKFEEARKLTRRNKRLQAKIRMGQLSKLILDFIKETPTEKDEETFKNIQEIVESADFDLNRVKLGNWQGRIITLSDIWEIEKDIQKE